MEEKSSGKRIKRMMKIEKNKTLYFLHAGELYFKDNYDTVSQLPRIIAMEFEK